MTSRQNFRKRVQREAESLLRNILGEENDNHDQKKRIKTVNHSVHNIVLEQEVLVAPNKENIGVSENIDVHNLNAVNLNESRREEEENDTINLANFLSEWSVKHKICTKAMNDILAKLKLFESTLPYDVRTLRSTPTYTNVIPMPPGSYMHYGIVNCLTDFFIEHSHILEGDTLYLNFAGDGLPLFKSNSRQLWPILLNVKNFEKVYLIGCYINKQEKISTLQPIKSISKPPDSNIFLQRFVEDLSRLLKEGFAFRNNVYKIKTNTFVCDAPARAFILNVKSHSGFYSCTKCTTKGERYERRVVFPELTAPLRTDHSFRLRLQSGHHTKLDHLVLESINFGCVSQFPLDYMHVVCLGVMKQLLRLWVKEKGQLYSFSSAQVDYISFENINLQRQFSKEFNRKPRSLHEMDRWKAVKFRTFLLYSSPFILRNVLSSCYYDHFMKFHVGIRILVDKTLYERYNYLANELLLEFVTEIPSLLPPTFRLSCDVSYRFLTDVSSRYLVNRFIQNS